MQSCESRGMMLGTPGSYQAVTHPWPRRPVPGHVTCSTVAAKHGCAARQCMPKNSCVPLDCTAAALTC